MSSAPPGANPRRAAFTLLEMLVVIGIITVLAGLVIGGGSRAVEAGRIARARTELAVLSSALEEYRRACGDYPQTDDAARLLQSLIGKRGPTNSLITGRCLLEISRFTIGQSRDPFSDSTAIFIDPWDEPYRYAYKSELPWSNPSYVLYSSGADRSVSPALLTGGFADVSSPLNADNLHADRPW